MKQWIYDKAAKDLTKRIGEAGLSESQIAMLQKIAERVWLCEAGIAREFWCDDCKARVERINELWIRFKKLVQAKDLDSKDKSGPGKVDNDGYDPGKVGDGCN